MLGLLYALRRPLAMVAFDPLHARMMGVDPRRMDAALMALVLTVVLAAVVAVAIKVVGVLLIAAMLIIPAAAARPLARTPESMALIAAAIGGLSALGGLQLAYRFDTPTGPTIVCLAAGLFALTSLADLVRAGADR